MSVFTYMEDLAWCITGFSVFNRGVSHKKGDPKRLFKNQFFGGQFSRTPLERAGFFMFSRINSSGRVAPLSQRGQECRNNTLLDSSCAVSYNSIHPDSSENTRIRWCGYFDSLETVFTQSPRPPFVVIYMLVSISCVVKETSQPHQSATRARCSARVYLYLV